MLPVLTVEQMRAADARALETVAEAALVERAGTAVGLAARRLLRTPYGRRVVVLAGKGNNGADGRVAARWLARRGASVTLVEARHPPARLAECDLVIDAALGTGFRGTYQAPQLSGSPRVLAVDIPSGVDGDTGEVRGEPLAADLTVTMAAWKPGLLQGEGAALAGRVQVADIGVEVARPALEEGGVAAGEEKAGPARLALVEDEDVDAALPARGRHAHKWETAVMVVAGSPGMEGASVLSSTGALRAGSGMVRLAVPGTEGGRPGPWPLEAVRLALPAEGWAERVLPELERCRALVVGPGLGRSDDTVAQVRLLVERSPVPAVVDADGLNALGEAPDLGAGPPVVLTPHDGEYRRLAGDAPGDDRVAAARRLAARCGATVLLKGSLTAVAAPSGEALLAAAGSPRLATAGTGDVLSGVIGALCGRGVVPLAAAALGAHVHGRAAGLGPSEGLVAGDLPELVCRWLSGRPPAPADSRPPGGPGA